MTEQILAYRGQNSYAQSEGAFTMSGSEPRESQPPKIESSERGPRRATPGRAENRDTTPRESLFKPLNRLENERPLIPFSAAEPAITIINQIQNEKDVVASGSDLAKIRALNEQFGDPDEAKKLKKPEDVVVYAQEVLRNSRIEEPTAEELHYTEGSPHAEGQKVVLKRQIAQAQGRNAETGTEDEEILTQEKARKHLTVEDESFGGVAEKGGPGASAGGATAWVDDLPKEDEVQPQVAIYLRRIKEVADEGHTPRGELDRLERFETLLDEGLLTGGIEDTDFTKKIRGVLGKRTKDLESEVDKASTGTPESDFKNAGHAENANKEKYVTPTETKIKELVKLEDDGNFGGVDWDNKVKDLLGELETFAEPATELAFGDYERVHYVARTINEFLYTEKNIPKETKEVLQGVLDFKSGTVSKIDRKFRRLWNDLTEKGQDGIAGDIDREGSTLFKQIVGGWGATVEQAKAKLLAMHTSKPLNEDLLRIREWRVYKSIEGVEKAVGLRQRMDIPVVWEDIPGSINRIYSFIESTDLAADELGTTINQVITLIQAVPYDTEATRGIRDKIIGNLEAFRAFHILRITLERADMNPEKVSSVFSDHFEGREEKTFEDFINRFSTDNKGREFILPKVNENGKFLDKDGNPTTDLAEAEFENINLFDVSFRLYSETLQDDRVRMNMIEAMTKHAIDGESDFSGSVVNQIMKDAGYDEALMPERWRKGDWEAELNKLRVYFRDHIDTAIKKKDSKLDQKGVDDVWGRLGEVNDSDKRVLFMDVTKETIQEWYRKNTLQGAFGTVGSSSDEKKNDADIKALLEEFEVAKKDGEDEGKYIKRGKEMFAGKSYLEVRREHLAGRLEKFLKDKGVGIDRALPGEEGHKPSAIDFEELRQSGYVKSVDFNAYNFAWMMMWSNYDSIRVYSRDTKRKYAKDDIYERVVINDATNLFFGRHIDHPWEFFHKDVENRGRSKEDDINELWMQGLPGKHHYIFPQNSLMVRWADGFMTNMQRANVKEKTEQLMRDYDFYNEKYQGDFESWMRSVAVMDMIENGQFTLGQSADQVPNPKDETDVPRDMSTLVKEKRLRKFEMIDVFGDRTRDLKFLAPDMFQQYLVNPTEGKFLDICNKLTGFYSTRVARLYPWMSIALRAHWEFASKHRQELFNDPNLMAAQADTLVDGLISGSSMERKQGEKEKRKLFGFNELGGKIWFTNKEVKFKLGEVFGIAPFRYIRQNAEMIRRGVWDFKLMPADITVSALFAMIAEFMKQLPRQLTGNR